MESWAQCSRLRRIPYDEPEDAIAARGHLRAGGPVRRFLLREYARPVGATFV